MTGEEKSYFEVRALSANHPSKVWPVFLGSPGWVAVACGSTCCASTAEPPLLSNVTVRLSSGTILVGSPNSRRSVGSSADRGVAPSWLKYFHAAKETVSVLA